MDYDVQVMLFIIHTNSIALLSPHTLHSNVLHNNLISITTTISMTVRCVLHLTLISINVLGQGDPGYDVHRLKFLKE